MWKRYRIDYRYSGVSGYQTVYARTDEEAVDEFYKKCKYCKREDKPTLYISSDSIDEMLLYSLDRSELIEIIKKTHLGLI